MPAAPDDLPLRADGLNRLSRWFARSDHDHEAQRAALMKTPPRPLVSLPGRGSLFSVASTTGPGHSVPAPMADVEAIQTAPSEPANGPLTKYDLARILTINSSKLVEELWTLTQKQVDFEIARHGRLEAKATSLLTATGLSLTVAFTFGATLIKEAAKFEDWYKPVVFSFGFACTAGLAAAGLERRSV